jgi:hypothetical protein
LKLFTDIHNKEFFNDFFILKEKVNQMRDRYLVYIKFRDKNIINRDMKTAFENEIKVFNHLIENSKKNILNKLQGEIQETRKKIENDLYKFFIVNPSEEFSGLQGDVLDYELRNLVYSIVKNIKFPTAKELLDELKLHYFYSDITWEDLNKNEFIKELEEKKLLSIKEKAYFDSLAMEATEDF